jgi:hypothetical protein
MTKSTSEKHQEPKGTTTRDTRRGTDGTKSVPIDPVTSDTGPGNSRGGGRKHPHSGKAS